MVCTESEAKTKWCSFAMCDGDAQSSHNMYFTNYKEYEFFHYKCIASGCMAWCVDKGASDARGEDMGYCGRNYRS